MRIILLCIISVCLIQFTVLAQGEINYDTVNPTLKGAYFGQTPPGLKPELFAPGVITTDLSEGCSGWGNDMEYFIFQRWIDRKSELYIMNQMNGVWSEPEPLPFMDKYQVGDFTVSPDGKSIVFASKLMTDEFGPDEEGANIWIIERTATGWTEPKPIGIPINTKYHDSYPSMAKNRNLYFFSRKPGGFGQSDIYMSEFVDGKYQTPVNLGRELNTADHEWDTYIAPDESYMIYCSMMDGGMGDDDLYVTFKNDDGSWGEPVNMGDEINSEKSENRPYVSPDGKYIFYTSTIRGNRDICWVDSKIIETLKDDVVSSTMKGPYLGQKPPSEIAELFAPGIISTDEKEALYGVFNNGSYIVFDRTPEGFTDWENYPIYICQEENGNWTKPVLTKHLGEPGYFNYPNPINNEELFYGWWLPLDENGAFTNLDIWKVKYSKGKWDEAEKLPYPINTKYVDMWPSITSDKVLYFFSTREGGAGRADIYRSVPENGKYTSVENLGPKINTSGVDHDPCISADGSFLIFSSNREGSLGKDDLFVAFQQKNGEWTDPINLGEKINSEASENRPYLTPDGKYLFFTSMRNGNLDIFWADIKIIRVCP